MSIPVNYQREKIKKYFNLLVENFITNPRHKKDISIVFEDNLGSSGKFRTLGHTQRSGGGSETTWKTINGVKVAGSERTTYFPYKYVISFLNNYQNEDELRGAVVHEFTHHYLYSTIGDHDHDDRFYSQMESLESWFDKNQGLSPRVDKSHDRDQYVGDNSSDTKDKENTCPKCSFLSPQHSPQCSHNQSNPRPTENTIDPQKAAEFDSLRKLLKNSKDLTSLEKNYQTVKGNSLYSSNKGDYNNKSRLDNLYQSQKLYLQSRSNDQLTNNSKSSLEENRSGVGSAFWLCLAGGGIILVGITGYLAASKPSYKPNRNKKR